MAARAPPLLVRCFSHMAHHRSPQAGAARQMVLHDKSQHFKNIVERRWQCCRRGRGQRRRTGTAHLLATVNTGRDRRRAGLGQRKSRHWKLRQALWAVSGCRGAWGRKVRHSRCAASKRCAICRGCAQAGPGHAGCRRAAGCHQSERSRRKGLGAERAGQVGWRSGVAASRRTVTALQLPRFTE